MSIRTEQVAALIQQQLGSMLLGLDLPAMTTITKVEVTPDLKHAKVWISVMPQDDASVTAVLQELKSNVYELQGELNRSLTMHHVPRISFRVDGSQEYASRINELIRKTHDEDAQ